MSLGTVKPLIASLTCLQQIISKVVLSAVTAFFIYILNDSFKLTIFED